MSDNQLSPHRRHRSERDQLELFRALPGDLAARDAQDLMAYPFFSLAKTKRVVPIDFRAGTITIRVEAVAGCSIAFDDANGMWALKTLEAFGKSGMPNLGLGQARQSFVAGNIAILADSTSYVAAAERQIGGRFQFKTIAFPLAATDGRLPAGGNVAMVFAKDAERQKAAWKYVKFVTGPVGQTAMVNSTGYMPGNEIAVTTTDLLGAFYAKNPNHQTSIRQLPVLTEWASFPGDNSLKIIEVIKHHVESLVTGKRAAEQVMPDLVGAVSNLLPKCGG